MTRCGRRNPGEGARVVRVACERDDINAAPQACEPLRGGCRERSGSDSPISPAHAIEDASAGVIDRLPADTDAAGPIGLQAPRERRIRLERSDRTRPLHELHRYESADKRKTARAKRKTSHRQVALRERARAGGDGNAEAGSSGGRPPRIARAQPVSVAGDENLKRGGSASIPGPACSKGHARVPQHVEPAVVGPVVQHDQRVALVVLGAGRLIRSSQAVAKRMTPKRRRRLQ